VKIKPLYTYCEELGRRGKDYETKRLTQAKRKTVANNCTCNSTPLYPTFSDVTILAKPAQNQFKSDVLKTTHSMKLI
jgi:hypothetical protein